MLASTNVRVFSGMILLGLFFGIGLGITAPTPNQAYMDPEPIISDIEKNMTSGSAQEPTDVDQVLKDRYGIDTHAEVELANELPRIETPADGYARAFYLSLVVGAIRIALYIANAVGPIVWHVNQFVPTGLLRMLASFTLAAWGYIRIKGDAERVGR